MQRNLVGVTILAAALALYATAVEGQYGGGMGGMGGGMGGMGGGMPKTQMQILLEESAKNPVVWSRPTGNEPAWLNNGKSSVDATESVRDKLNETIFVETAMASITDTREYLAEQLGLQIDWNHSALNDEGLSVESIPGLRAGEGAIRELLRRTLDPVGLTYRVCEGYVEITTKSDADEHPSMRFYDLSYVARDSSRLFEILNAIQTSVKPDCWDQNGGHCTCVPVGQVLIVRTDESSHLEIERLLARLSVAPAVEPAKPAAALPGASPTVIPNVRVDSVNSRGATPNNN